MVVCRHVNAWLRWWVSVSVVFETGRADSGMPWRSYSTAELAAFGTVIQQGLETERTSDTADAHKHSHTFQVPAGKLARHNQRRISFSIGSPRMVTLACSFMSVHVIEPGESPFL